MARLEIIDIQVHKATLLPSLMANSTIYSRILMRGKYTYRCRMTGFASEACERRMRRRCRRGMWYAFMANAAASGADRQMTLRTVHGSHAGVPSTGFVRTRACVAMATVAEIFLMADHAPAAVPRSLAAMGHLAPCVVMVSRFLVLVTFDAGIFAVACKAIGIPRLGLDTVVEFPVQLVSGIDRARFSMARAAILTGGCLVIVTDETGLHLRQDIFLC